MGNQVSKFVIFLYVVYSPVMYACFCEHVCRAPPWVKILVTPLSSTDLTFSENVTSACEIHGLPKCVLCKCTAISDATDSLIVGFVKHVFVGISI